ncbi:putative aryl-alcohol dehydrogenase AAD10 [Colletotrichum sidae]|uniref:Putative aryl-alcohol dehydrogenase AAD10 n=1 Tax=Colletotrichum sidae TaxID=1347389 RepID=A0A4R8TEC5_9PEZI|nr:putative aryl-alcohol dehydrogenase AAD10 [Colletotrichum sidae]
MDSLFILVDAANQYALDRGKTPFSVYQGRWGVTHRDFERDILPVARAYGLALCPWDVLGSGKFQMEKAAEERARAGEGLWSSVTAVALAYVRSKALDVIPIVGGRKVEHLRDNIDAPGFKLTDEQIALLEGVKEFDVAFPTNFLGPDPNITGHSARLSRGSRMSFPNARRQTSV